MVNTHYHSSNDNERIKIKEKSIHLQTMQSPKNELKVYSEDAPPKPWEMEHLIVKIVLFFMQPKNWSFTNIENTLIPGI